MTVNHDSGMPVGATVFEVEVLGVENALCAVSRDYTLLGSAYTDENGDAVIEFEDPLGPGAAQLTVTAYNKIPYLATLEVTGDNTPPFTPDKPTGPQSGKPGTIYTYESTTTDPDEHSVYYMWDWGDGNYSIWLGPYDSGDTCEANYNWSEKGTYAVRVKARDIFYEETDWSDPLSVTMPLSFSFMDLLEERFPRVFTVLSFLLEQIQRFF
jgi:hypothetical protein